MAADDAMPLWFPSPVSPRILELLTRVKMLDAAHRVPSKSWRGWIEPALNRIAAASDAGRKAGQASAEARRARAGTVVERPLNGSGKSFNPANQPSSHPALPRTGAPARGGAPSAIADELRSAGEMMAAAGIKPEIVGRKP